MVARVGLLVLLLAGIASAQGRGPSHEPPTPEQIERVRAIVGDELWGQMPEWRRHNVVQHYQKYLRAPAEMRERIEKRGIKDFLMRPSRRSGKRALPPELHASLERLDPKLRRTAGKLAFVRLRQLRFDRNLALLPQAERRRWFARLFPEPFNRTTAKEARLEFEKTIAQAIATRLKPELNKLEGLPKDEWRTRSLEIVRAFTAREEKRVLDIVLKQLQRLEGVPTEGALRQVSGDVALVLEQRNIYATPRQRELIRWAMRPHECPLLDFSWMGERPKQGDSRASRTERRAWNRDVQVLGRLSLLSEAGIPKDSVLHLASASSDEDFVRALSDLLGRGARAERDAPVRRTK